MPISFNQVPIDIRVPGQYIEIDNSMALKGLTGIPTRVLLVGQKLAAGAQAPLVPVLITSGDQGEQFFGKGSHLASMIAKFRAVNSFTPLWAIAQADAGAGVAATASVTITGPASAAGTLTLYIGGLRVRVAVAANDTANTMASALAAAIAADPRLPVTALVNGPNPAKVDLTARNKGTLGNAIDLRTAYYSDEALPAGVVVALTGMAGGAGDPDVQAALDAIGDEWFTDIVVSYNDTANIVALEAALAERFGPLKMIDAHAYIGVAGTHAALVTKGTGRNSPHVSMIGAKGSPTPPWEWAAVLGGQCAFYGKQDPARPFQTLELTGLMAPVIADRFTFQERDILLRSGISTFTVDEGGLVRIERVITTYRENPFGAPDISYLDLNTLKTLTYLRFDLRAFIALRYPRYKLADDGTIFSRGQAVVTPKVIRASIVARFRAWEEAGLVENIEQFKKDLIVERDSLDPNRVNALVPPDIVNQLVVFAGLVQFRL
jgi:phage tail sheath gpL-like